MAKVLIVGSGGREHALAIFLARSPQVDIVYTAPGNAGTPNNVPIEVTGEEGFHVLAGFVEKNGVDLTVVGPEAPLCAGMANAFRARELLLFGPCRGAARLEADKAYARQFMKEYGIPHPQFAVFQNYEQARGYVAALPEGRVVVKAAGLAGGKGALVCESRMKAQGALRSLMAERILGAAGERVVIEEFMEGEEATITAICDGRRSLYLASSQDHKRALDGDQGSNTGGMGAYAPAPVVTDEVLRQVDEEIVRPTLEGLLAEGTPYRGCLYVGLMIHDGRPRVVEFNCRFGDPEIQAVLPLLEDDLYELLRSAAEGDLGGLSIHNRRGAACCVVLASAGYPGAYEKGKLISGLAEAQELNGVYVFHAGTRRLPNGEVVTAGGRVLGITGVGASIHEAIQTAYLGVERVRFDGCRYRRDIGHRSLNR